mmetsp:Transcript_9347/g.25167  ORF Transcript_9347/g.25167 Transcript_9347/m.25167 type:complete len:200 (-) Transcript_9347:1300-1899(-)
MHEQLVGCFRNMDAARHTGALHPAGCVHRVPKDGELGQLGADESADHVSRVQPHSNTHRLLCVWHLDLLCHFQQRLGKLHHPLCRLSRVDLLLLHHQSPATGSMLGRHYATRNDVAISCCLHLVDAVNVCQLVKEREELVQKYHDFHWFYFFTHRCETTDVHEHQSDAFVGACQAAYMLRHCCSALQGQELDSMLWHDA